MTNFLKKIFIICKYSFFKGLKYTTSAQAQETSCTSQYMSKEETVTLACVLGRYESYGSLSSEECGIVHGCENGRCIRVEEGYTCDCYDGYQLDITTMMCIGIAPLFIYVLLKTELFYSPTPLGEAINCVFVWL